MLRANPVRRPLGFQGMYHPLKSFYSSLSLYPIPSLRPPTPLGHHRRPASCRWWLSMPAQWVVALLLPLGTGSSSAVRSGTGSFNFGGKGGATIAEFLNPLFATVMKFSAPNIFNFGKVMIRRQLSKWWTGTDNSTLTKIIILFRLNFHRRKWNWPPGPRR